ncbi:MAG: ABC transporter ATP-binding protein [Nitrososphaeria archaeon]
MNNTLLSVEDLHIEFKTYLGKVHAVNGAYLTVNKGECVGLVGETGCGKSTLGFSIVKLLDEAARIVKGKIIFKGEPILEKKEDELREIRRKEISLIFQDPTAALNPVYTIGDQIVEALILSREMTKKNAVEESVNILASLGIPDPKKVMLQYPHELSGGMRQRVMIAVALSKKPSLLIADEPTSNLDVTVQAQILELLDDLRKNTDMSVLLITHDMGVVAQVCDKVAVMYGGQVIEFGDVREIFKNSLHPYTRGLLKVANLVGEKTRLESISGAIPDLRSLPEGCLFYSRCPKPNPICFKKRPRMVEAGTDHFVACWNFSSDYRSRE